MNCLIAMVCLFTQISSIPVRTYIPRGMPVKLTVKQDQEQTNNFSLKTEAGPDVKYITVVEVFLTSPSGSGSVTFRTDRFEIDKTPNHFVVTNPTRISIDNVPNYKRLVVFVERVETETGVWVLEDPSDDRVALRLKILQALAERRSNPLPRAKFIPN